MPLIGVTNTSKTFPFAFCFVVSSDSLSRGAYLRDKQGATFQIHADQGFGLRSV
jgi:hypothetical protein